MSSGHAAPPPEAACVMTRVRVISPSPQVALHADEAVHPDTRQATGQECSLQPLLSKSVGHAAPPSAVGLTISRTRCWEPLPHSSVQLPQGCHPPTTQSTAHGTTLHSADSVRSGHALPLPDDSTIIVRECVLMPPPHAKEQLSKIPHSDTTQSMGQPWVLQGRDCSKSGQGAPSI